jgi:maltose O-acetyltransferase
MIAQRIKRKIDEIRLKWRYHGLLWLDQISSFVPGRIGWRVRRWSYGSRMDMGKNVEIDEHVRIKYPQRMKIGDNSFLGRGTMIQAGGRVNIGNDVIIGPFVKIWSSDHVFDDLNMPIHKQGHNFAMVTIGEDVWIGTGAIILKGVTIGKGAVVAAGSVVAKDILPYAICAGNPATTIRFRRQGDKAHE